MWRVNWGDAVESTAAFASSFMVSYDNSFGLGETRSGPVAVNALSFSSVFNHSTFCLPSAFFDSFFLGVVRSTTVAAGGELDACVWRQKKSTISEAGTAAGQARVISVSAPSSRQHRLIAELWLRRR